MTKKLSLKIKLSIICMVLVIIPTFMIGGFSYYQFRLLGKETIAESYSALKDQTLAILEAGIKTDRQVIVNLLEKVSHDLKTLVESSSVNGYLSASNGKNDVLNQIPQKEAAIIANNIYQMCVAQRQILYHKLSTDLAVFEKILVNNGGAELESLTQQWAAVNPYTSETFYVTLPMVQIGFDILQHVDDFETTVPVVDEAKALIDSHCSIFQRMNENGDMMLIGTTLNSPIGNRATSYYMPSKLKDGSPNPIIDAILHDNEYKGRAHIVNQWFISAFRPLKDKDGNIIGMLNVGARETDNVSVIKMVKNTVIGQSGYSLIFDPTSTIIIHPNQQYVGRNLIEDLGVEQLSNAWNIIHKNDQGLFNYMFQGRKKFVYYHYFKPWDWIICATGYWDEFNQEETAKQMLKNEIKAIADNAHITVAHRKRYLYHSIRYINEKGYEICRYQDKKFVNSNLYVGNQRWFKNAQSMLHGNLVNMGVVQNENETVLRISAPLAFENKSMGLISIDFKWSILCELIKQRSYGKSSYTFMINPDGVLVVHPEYTFKDQVSLFQSKSKSLSDIAINRMAKGMWGHNYYTDKGTRYLIVYTPVTIGEYTYSFGITIAEDSFLSIANNMKTNIEKSFRDVVKLLGFNGIVMIVCGVLAAYFMIKRIIRPIINLSHITERIADYDLSVHIFTNRNDEIGQLSKAIKKMVIQFRKLIGEAQSSGKGLANTSNQMLDISTHLVKIYEASSEQASNVASASKDMTSSINAIADTTSKMSSHTKEVNKRIEKMSHNINFVTTSINEMSTAMIDVRDDADQGTRITKDAMKQAKVLKSVMTSLKDAAGEIDDVTDVIKGIADKTNLLALNAAIEAASAGDAGKGFAIVANAIQRFAEQNTDAAEDIAERIYQVQEKTDGAFKSISRIIDVISRMHTTSETIRTVIDEQSQASERILSNSLSINNISNDIVIAMNDLKDGISDVNLRIAETSSGALQVSQNIHHVSRSTESSNQSIAKVNHIADHLNRLSIKYQEIVDVFKIDSQIHGS